MEMSNRANNAKTSDPAEDFIVVDGQYSRVEERKVLSQSRP